MLAKGLEIFALSEVYSSVVPAKENEVVPVRI